MDGWVDHTLSIEKEIFKYLDFFVECFLFN